MPLDPDDQLRLSFLDFEDVDRELLASLEPALERHADSIVAAFGSRPPLAYAAGHEHNLQVLDGLGARYLLISGTGIYDHLSQVFRLDGSRYARAASGFIRVDLLRGGRVRLGVLLADEDGQLTEDFSMWLEDNP